MSTLDRIAKALNLAENAGTPEEAATAMETAQRLATLAQIDLAVARQHTVDKEKREEIADDMRVDVNPYNRRFNRKYFTDLFLAIAHVNDCRALIGDYHVWLTGYPSDIEVTQALFGILSVQMVAECDQALKNGAHKVVKRVPKRQRVEIPDYERKWGDPVNEEAYDPETFYASSQDEYDERVRWSSKELADRICPLPPKFRLEKVRDDEGRAVYEEQAVSSVDGRHYRQNFYEGFIARTSSRLWEAKRKANDEAGATEGSSTALALRNKTEEVEQAYEEKVKRLNPRGTYSGAQSTVPVVNAWQHGSDAAARARLEQDDNAVGTTKRMEIGG